jgi:anti-sigma-K factor RskA
VSDDRTIPPGGPDPDLTAGELALGLLEGDERAIALRRVLAEPGFAREVERWRSYLAQLFADWPAIEPPAGLWDRIAGSLDGARRSRPISRLWRPIAGVTTLIAACLALVLFIRPAPPPPPGSAPAPIAHGPMLVAQLAPSPSAASGAQAVAAVYDPVTDALRVGPAPLAGTGKAAELWVIPAGGAPHSMGVLNPDRETPMPVGPHNRPLLAPGATLAISIEPPGGSPTGKPTGPVVATGALAVA